MPANSLAGVVTQRTFNPPEPQPHPLQDQHLKEVHLMFDQYATDTAKLGHIKLISYD